MEKLRGLWNDKIKVLDKIKKDNLVIVLLVGVLLIVISIPVKDEDKKKQTENEVETTNISNSVNEKSYEETLEEKLEEILKDVQGVGDVKVMITLKSSRELIVEKDIPTESTEITEEDGQGGKRTTVEKKITQSTVYSDDETNGSTPYVVKEIEPEIEGVVVLAKGGDNPEVISGITEAIQALFAVDAHKIKVMKMN